MAEAMSEEREQQIREDHAKDLRDIETFGLGALVRGGSGPTGATGALLAEIDRLRAQLAEMTRCRDNAMAYANREHVPIDLDDEIDTDGEELANRIEGELLGPGWDWEDDRTPGQLARTAVAVIRPHLARLTDQAQKARAQLAEIGETREEWGQKYSGGGYLTRANSDWMRERWPIEQWAWDNTRHGGVVGKRTIIVIEDWQEIRSGDLPKDRPADKAHEVPE